MGHGIGIMIIVLCREIPVGAIKQTSNTRFKVDAFFFWPMPSMVPSHEIGRCGPASAWSVSKQQACGFAGASAHSTAWMMVLYLVVLFWPGGTAYMAMSACSRTSDVGSLCISYFRHYETKVACMVSRPVRRMGCIRCAFRLYC